MSLTRPHTLSFELPGTGSGQDDNGLPIEGTPGTTLTMPCRFHLGGSKVFKNQDSTESNQIGTIRLDSGEDLPEVGQTITITEEDYTHFSGPVKEVYKAQQSSRIEV